MRRRDEAADPGQRAGRDRRRALKDLRLRLRDRVLFARDRVGEGQDAGPGGDDPEQPDRRGAGAAAGEDPLLDPRRGCDQGGDRRLPQEARPPAACGKGSQGGLRTIRTRGHTPLLIPQIRQDRLGMITLTERAATHVSNFLSKRGKGVGLRLGVRTSGCSGLAYRIEYADAVNPEDQTFESHGVKVVVDPKSLQFLEGTELDFTREGLNEGFKFNNPNVKDECGCGESFNV